MKINGMHVLLRLKVGEGEFLQHFKVVKWRGCRVEVKRSHKQTAAPSREQAEKKQLELTSNGFQRGNFGFSPGLVAAFLRV